MKTDGMFNAVFKCERDGHGFHFVIVCDETGIYDAFYCAKDLLVTGRDSAILSFIYTISDKNLHPLFEQELSILEKRFPHNLVVLLLKIDTTKYCFKQELIEATINSNTLPVMKFSVFGNAEFVNFVSRILLFFDVKKFLITSKII